MQDVQVCTCTCTSHWTSRHPSPASHSPSSSSARSSHCRGRRDLLGSRISPCASPSRCLPLRMTERCLARRGWCRLRASWWRQRSPGCWAWITAVRLIPPLARRIETLKQLLLLVKHTQ
eukprot:scaffold254447_cov28-Tisochrysis_lutea.AAC.2